MKIIGTFCEFSGTVAFRDNTTGIFHAQGEAPGFPAQIVWSVDQGESQRTLADVYADPTYRAAVTAVWSASGSGGLAWTPSVAPTGRTIASVVYHLSMLFSGDDGLILPISVTYENGSVIMHTPGVTGTQLAPTNIADLSNFIYAMLNQVLVAA
jgi:hypothetical protein